MKNCIFLSTILICVGLCTGCGDNVLPKEIKSIVDTAEEKGACFMCAEEAFYEDENYVYTFAEDPMSHYIIVTYTNGFKQNVAEALEKGNIEINDLDTYGIRYEAVPKHIAWLGVYYEGPHEIIEEPEEIYRDDKYIYYILTTSSDYMKVFYKDETQQDLKSALAEGKIRITDLEFNDVDYYKEPINKILRCDRSNWYRMKHELEEDNSLRMGRKRYPTITDNLVLVHTKEEITLDTGNIISALYYLSNEHEEERYEYYIQYETAEDAIEAVDEFEDDERVIEVLREETKPWVS